MSVSIRASDEELDSSLARVSRVSVGTRVSYSLPAFGLSALQLLMSTFIPRFYSDVLKVPVSVIGYVSLAALVFDALSDIVIGFASDFTRTRWGRRRPYIVTGGVLASICCVCTLSPPHFSSSDALIVWAVVFILLFILSQTVLRVPWLALGYELNAEYDEKTVVFSIREGFYIIGTIVAASLPLIVDGILGTDDSESSQRLAFLVLGIVVGIINLGTALVCAFKVKERHSLPPVNFKRVFRAGCGLLQKYKRLISDVFHSRHARSLLVSVTLYSSATYLNAFFFPYFVTYIVRAEDNLELILLTYIITGIVFIPMWVYLCKKFEKKLMCKLAMMLQSTVLFIAFFCIDGDEDVTLYTALVAVAAVSFGGFATIKFSMISDVVDVDEWERQSTQNTEDVRREGEFQGLFDLCSKCLSALIIGPSFVILDNYGYSPNEVQSDGSQATIKFFYAMLPAIMGFVAVLVLLPYNLTRKVHAQLEADNAVSKTEHQENATIVEG